MAQGPWRESSQGRGKSPTEPQHSVTPQLCILPHFPPALSLASRQENRQTSPPVNLLLSVYEFFQTPSTWLSCSPFNTGIQFQMGPVSLWHKGDDEGNVLQPGTAPGASSLLPVHFPGAQGGREELEEELPCTYLSQGQSSGWFEQLTHQKLGRESTAGSQPHYCCSVSDGF